jgi:hypothetical protein
MIAFAFLQTMRVRQNKAWAQSAPFDIYSAGDPQGTRRSSGCAVPMPRLRGARQTLRAHLKMAE